MNEKGVYSAEQIDGRALWICSKPEIVCLQDLNQRTPTSV